MGESTLGRNVCTESGYMQTALKCKPLSNTTAPFEFWKGKKPDVGHLRVLDSNCWHLLKKTGLNKLDVRVREGTFVGYASKLYQIWDFEEGAIYAPWDVTFDEYSHQSSSNSVVKEMNNVDGSRDALVC